MNKNILYIMIPLMFLVIGNVKAQTVVNSLSELQTYLDQDNVNVTLTPGDYYVTANDVATETIGQYWSGTGGIVGNSYDIFQIAGNNSTYDFTGVTIYIETETAQSVGYIDFYEIRFIGNNNIVKNLTVVDDGNVNDAPTKRASNIGMDGANNTLEGCHFTVKGSSPYGYGDMFGKGGNKRSACLVRGQSNKVKNCTFIHRAFGHGIFFQAANDPIVEGCYIEGELRTTDEVKAENGTGSYADNLNFDTTYGFNLRDELEGNFYFSCQEDGIRSYNAGETIIDGVEYDRPITNATVTNSTVIKMRSGVTIGWANGTKLVENCTALACEANYWVGGSTDVINCKGDASAGALYSTDLARGSASNIELTLLDSYVPPLDGEITALYFASSDHNVTIHDGTTSYDDNIEIHIGEARLGYRFKWGSNNEPYDFNASNLTFTNNTNYPIYVGDKATNTDITTCGPVVADDGSGTSITQSTSCDYDRPCINSADNLQAECYDDMLSIGTRTIAGSQNDREIFGINNGDWISFNAIDLTGMVSINAIASGLIDNIEIEVRDGATNGALLATIPISSTSSNSNYQEFSTNLNSTINGATNIYFVFKHATETGWLFNLDKLSFIQDPCSGSNHDAYTEINAMDYCEMLNVTPIANSQYITGIQDGSWIRYGAIDFTSEAPAQITCNVSSTTETGIINVMLDNPENGTLIATIPVPNTGGSTNWRETTVQLLDDITETHNVYLYFKNGDFNIDWFQFHEERIILRNLALASNGSIASHSVDSDPCPYGGCAELAIDGNTNGSFGGGSVSHSSHGSSGSLKWWQVDLRADYRIETIDIYNRTGGYQSRLSDITIEVIDSENNIVFTEFYEGYPNPSATISTGGVDGRIVKISKTTDTGITLAEVEVYGSNTLSAGDVLKLKQINIFPNPTRNEITVTNDYGNNLTLEIYNINGILELKLLVSENKKVISLENLSSGIHFLKFKTDQETTVKKVIKL